MVDACLFLTMLVAAANASYMNKGPKVSGQAVGDQNFRNYINVPRPITQDMPEQYVPQQAFYQQQPNQIIPQGQFQAFQGQQGQYQQQHHQQYNPQQYAAQPQQQDNYNPQPVEYTPAEQNVAVPAQEMGQEELILNAKPTENEVKIDQDNAAVESEVVKSVVDQEGRSRQQYQAQSYQQQVRPNTNQPINYNAQSTRPASTQQQQYRPANQYQAARPTNQQYQAARPTNQQYQPSRPANNNRVNYQTQSYRPVQNQQATYQTQAYRPANQQQLINSVLKSAPSNAHLIRARDNFGNRLVDRLPDNYTLIRPLDKIVDTFSCEGRIYGYYGDMENDCQIFHVCLPLGKLPWPQTDQEIAPIPDITYQFSFICPAYTAFTQDALVCAWATEAVPCEMSEQLYDVVNGEFFKEVKKESPPAPAPPRYGSYN